MYPRGFYKTGIHLYKQDYKMKMKRRANKVIWFGCCHSWYGWE